MGDIYPFTPMDECMVRDCPCPLPPSRVEFKVNDGSVFAWLCPCHFLMTLDAVVEIEVKNGKFHTWKKEG